ncbi:MAG: 6-bladed beta-propeller [Tannerella sp.]|jgi:hypothetical protein|nr:6-bladed beta-propeller [Tannerella sp.]
MKNLLLFFLIASCTGEKKYIRQESQKDLETNSLKSEVQFKDLNLFSDCKEYDNHLSSIISSMEFVKVAYDPPLDDFWKIYSVEVGAEYIFISTIYKIYMYDNRGNFIRSIGTRGQGPKEFIQLSNIQMDEQSRKLYTLDVRRERMMVYDFEGNLLQVIPLKFSERFHASQLSLLDSTTILFRRSNLDGLSNISFICSDSDGKEKKIFHHHIAPVNRNSTEFLSPDYSFLWDSRQYFNYLEYGNDTVFGIRNDSIIPELKLTGDLKGFFKRHSGKKLNILSYVTRPDAAIFESDTMMVFKMSSEFESYYKVYNKYNNKFHRTNYKNAEEDRFGARQMAYFVDDMATGLRFNPHFQSKGKAIALIYAGEICGKREEILDFIDKHPTETGKNLRPVIENFTEDDNCLMMIVKFK